MYVCSCIVFVPIVSLQRGNKWGNLLLTASVVVQAYCESKQRASGPELEFAKEHITALACVTDSKPADAIAEIRKCSGGMLRWCKQCELKLVSTSILNSVGGHVVNSSIPNAVHRDYTLQILAELSLIDVI
jgi:hypothetical protein